ncbi:MAG: amidophosphoribosyltransferase, partial [Alphaproteobacteria bacterium]|nr:amidophosphoribosyltransferase [Alphaproteobacteria bacterium]
MITTNPFDGDHLHEECAVFGIYGHSEAATHAALGLHALQHRGQEAAGIVTHDGAQFHAHRGIGLVGDIFVDQAVIGRLKGNIAIGHTRYSTTGELMMRNVQPLFAELEIGGLAIAHNGNLTNAQTVRSELVHSGCIFQSTTDTEIIVHLMATNHGTVVERLIAALRQVEGAYSLAAMAQDRLIGVRDPNGVRPLVLGRLGDSYILASESCAFDIIGADYVRDIEPGELVVIGPDGLESHRPFPPAASRFCIFEHIYFAKPDSVVDGTPVYEARKQIGMELAREQPVGADVAVPVPDSGVPSAIGFAAEAGIPYELGIIRNHYVGRTFI